MSLCGVPSSVVNALLQTVLTEVGATEPGFVEDLTEPRPGGLPSAVDTLLASGFGGCSYDALPTAPYAPPFPGGLPDLAPVSTLGGAGE